MTKLTSLTLRAGVNRVGINGADILANLFTKLPKLEYLNLYLAESYFGDEGAIVLTKSLT
mgnify:CR=1 FL=1